MKCIIKLLLIILLCVPSLGYAYKNEPNGFRDLYWGETLQEIQRGRATIYNSYNSGTNSVYYWVKLNADEEPTISGVPIRSSSMLAALWNNKLIMVAIFCEGENNYFKLCDSMKTLYGEPTETHANELVWIGKSSVISISQENNTSIISLYSTQLLNEAAQQEARRGW